MSQLRLASGYILPGSCYYGVQGPELDGIIDVVSPPALYRASEPSGKEFLGQLRLMSLCSASRVSSAFRDNVLLSSYNGKPMAMACVTWGFLGSLWPIDCMGTLDMEKKWNLYFVMVGA